MCLQFVILLSVLQVGRVWNKVLFNFQLVAKPSGSDPSSHMDQPAQGWSECRYLDCVRLMLTSKVGLKLRFKFSALRYGSGFNG